jgi:hypothetical protein
MMHCEKKLGETNIITAGETAPPPCGIDKDFV